MFAYIVLFKLAFAGSLTIKTELGGLARFGPPAREFVSASLAPDLATAPVGLEAGFPMLRPARRLGFRPSVSLEGWTRRWEDLPQQRVWSHEFGLRIEPRFAVRLLLTRRALWSYRWAFVPTIDVGAGIALVMFADAQQGHWAASPTLSVRPAIHLGRYSPGFLALDLRIGIHGKVDDCQTGRSYCPETQLNPGGTSVGFVVGGTLP